MARSFCCFCKTSPSPPGRERERLEVNLTAYALQINLTAYALQINLTAYALRFMRRVHSEPRVYFSPLYFSEDRLDATETPRHEGGWVCDR